MSNDYLKRSDFYEYMGDFREDLESRLARLETRVDSENQKKYGKNHEYKEKLILILIGGILALAGVASGVLWL